jgi:anhydro-N-acetylmuramic acid kinase
MNVAPASRQHNASSFYIGLMSGTSLDGVDGVLVNFTLHPPHLQATASVPLPANLRQQLLALNTPGHNELHSAAQAAYELALLSSQVCEMLLAQANLPAKQVAAIGSHGQTVRHQPPGRASRHPYTLQINQPAVLAEQTGIHVVADFRSRDVAAGGQGAPLVPAFHQALFAQPGSSRLVINIGGMANITALAADGQVWGMDTGPGNVLLDLWCRQHTGQWFDANGAWAATGRVHPGLLEHLLQAPYFSLTGIKSTGRDDFNLAWLHSQLDAFGHEPLQPQDVQATLVELTARTIAQCAQTQQAAAWGGKLPTHAWVCGGGARNGYLMSRLQHVLGPAVQLGTTDEAGWPGEWMEAAAFAWLAQQCLLGLAGNVPSVTGASGPRVLGAIYPA